MAGKTGLVVGLLHNVFIHVPPDLIVSYVKRLDLEGPICCGPRSRPHDSRLDLREWAGRMLGAGASTQDWL